MAWLQGIVARQPRSALSFRAIRCLHHPKWFWRRILPIFNFDQGNSNEPVPVLYSGCLRIKKNRSWQGVRKWQGTYWRVEPRSHLLSLALARGRKTAVQCACWSRLAGDLCRDAAGQTFNFTQHGFASGVSEFEITGLDPNAGVSPTDITAFVTGLTFMTDGNFTGTMQAIAVNAVPEPSTWALMLLGFLGLGFAFRQSPRKVSFA
jgi:hypothetical protein